MVIGPYNLTYNAHTMNTPKIYFMARSQTRVKAVRLEFYFQRPNLEILCTAASICECPHNTTYHQEFIA